jgi:rhodanese-related sulfurtransferase
MAIPDEPTTIEVADLPSETIPEGYLVLDVREDDEWEAGHAPGALHIPLADLPDRVEEDWAAAGREIVSSDGSAPEIV